MFNKLSAVITTALIKDSDEKVAVVDEKFERRKMMFNAVLFVVFTTLAFIDISFADIKNVGQNIRSTAGTILSPIGWTVAAFYAWQAFSSDHDKMKNFAKAAGGALVGLWDNTISFIEGLFR
jgi:hypothetical protein